MYYMKFQTTMTSKGTITISAPIRKALGLKPGNKINIELDEENERIIMNPGMTLEKFEKIRDEILSKYPNRPKGLSMSKMRDLAAKAWQQERR